MKNANRIMMGLLLIVIALTGCASTESFSISRETTAPPSQQYYCCAMGGSIQGTP